MQTKLLYLQDSYLKESEAEVLEVLGNQLIFDQTIFYPTSGGQPNDKGWIKSLIDKTFSVEVIDVKKSEDKIIHYTSKDCNNSFNIGDKVLLQLDWNRRYRLMRMHTAAHVLAAVLYKENILISGNQLGEDKSRFDFNLENFDQDFLKEAINKANQICKEGQEVKSFFISKDQIQNYPGIIKLLSKNILEKLEKIRLVEIEGTDIQADGGTHVKNTAEVGEILFLKAENKGKNNRRVYFSLYP
ncbi:MAG: alanine--tRNA ligase-related protein [Candidatus Anstonellaceae archaeon]